MSQENVEVARRGYEAFAQGDLETVLGLLAPELISEEAEQTLDTPATYHGPESRSRAVGARRDNRSVQLSIEEAAEQVADEHALELAACDARRG